MQGAVQTIMKREKKSGYLILDSGGGSTRAALALESGAIAEIRAIKNIFYTEENGGVSFAPELWFDAIKAMMKEVVKDHPDIEIRAVTATSAREGVVLIGKDGQAFLGLPNSDKRGRPLRDAVALRCDLYSLTGKWCDPLFSAFKIAGFREQEPQLADRLKTFTSISEWLGYEMTGIVAMEPSHACETALFHTASGEWSEELCEVFGISPQLLPPLKSSGTELGKIRRELLDELGIREEIPFVITGADTQAAAYSCTDKTGELILISGTTSPLVVRMDEPLLDPGERFWLDRDILSGWMAETNTGASGITIQNYLEQTGNREELDQIDARIREKNRMACIGVFGDKYFAGGRSLAGKGWRLTGQEREPDDADRIAALRMDIAFGVAENRELLRKIIPEARKGDGFDRQLICCGGGMKSELQGQWIADAAGCPVIVREQFMQASVDGCRRVLNRFFGLGEGERKTVRVFYPVQDSVILPWRELWRRYRQELNSDVIRNR